VKSYRQYARGDPLTFKAIPQPMAFTAVAKGVDVVCPCCRRLFGGDIERFFRAIAAGAVRALLLASTAHPIEAS
jgi:hypothetical protein